MEGRHEKGWKGGERKGKKWWSKERRKEEERKTSHLMVSLILNTSLSSSLNSITFPSFCSYTFPFSSSFTSLLIASLPFILSSLILSSSSFSLTSSFVFHQEKTPLFWCVSLSITFKGICSPYLSHLLSFLHVFLLHPLTQHRSSLSAISSTSQPFPSFPHHLSPNMADSVHLSYLPPFPPSINVSLITHNKKSGLWKEMYKERRGQGSDSCRHWCCLLLML